MRIILGIIVVFAATACRYDKEAHLTIGLASSQYVAERTGSALQGCAASFGLGILKEFVDSRTDGVVDSGDVIATAAACQVTYRW